MPGIVIRCHYYEYYVFKYCQPIETPPGALLIRPAQRLSFGLTIHDSSQSVRSPLLQ